MMRLLIWALVAFYLLTGLYIAILPHDFYLNAPGAQATGPYNMHVIRDVGFAFLTSSLAIASGSASMPFWVAGVLFIAPEEPASNRSWFLVLCGC